MNINTNTQAIDDMMINYDMYSGDMHSGEMYSGDMHSGEMYSNDMDHDSNTINYCTGDYMSITGEYCGEWVGAKIVKLPIWGVQEEDSENYFEYPSSEEFAGWSPDVKLSSLLFGANDLLVGAV